MKKIVLLLAGMYFSQVMFAQQRSHYTQYILNNYILNPALTGIENYTDVKISARDQWVGLNGAPRTTYLTVHGPIGKKDYRTTATSFEVPGENPRGSSYWETYNAAEPHHGVGMSIVNDRTGNFNRFSANVSYAYHIGISARTSLAAGFAGGISSIGLNTNGKAFFGSDPTDPSVGGAVAKNLRKIKPDFSAGLWLYSADYFVGLSGQQIIPQKLAFVDDATFKTTGKLIPHVFLTAGYRFLLNEDINMLPSVMLKYISGAFKNDYQVEVNTKLQYRDAVWVGASYRQFDGYAAMAGFNVAHTFSISYAYDYTKTDLGTFTKGTHELMIGFLIGNRYGDTCPRNVW
ncbi:MULTISPECIES: PorP/SprF family type IX secretion system membrane protein [Niastella]|uniref:Type IX secretion system membrane protein PorP/SprF n=1 Tax=Niastella soli TaxID=2821487 RepID=A0ABS3YY32_9BACT|nr:type IX secretion system membrane protein PorP/SprF [Niastella soli]MBO9202823.1 type IX secretion system membrane protein PorP/SprF [Niastella soli]